VTGVTVKNTPEERKRTTTTIAPMRTQENKKESLDNLWTQFTINAVTGSSSSRLDSFELAISCSHYFSFPFKNCFVLSP
jgi:hypothetical protein